MGILDIKNRTENFKTAKTFAPFLVDGNDAEKRLVDLANCLGKPVGGSPVTEQDEVRLELFWYGMRDNLPDKQRDYTPARAVEWARRYESICGSLRTRIDTWNRKQPKRKKFSDLNEDAYRATNAKRLYSNLVNTEFDIVLQTPGHLFIGEAKHLSGLNANGQRVLVHQLIRQFVAAKVLLSERGSDKEIVPFIVCDKDGDHGKAKLVNTAQARFMLAQGWLNKENILTWDDIDRIAKG